MEEETANTQHRDDSDDGPITFEDLGIKSGPKLADSALGKVRFPEFKR